MTEEQADEVYELAYEKYIEESRALDRHTAKKAEYLNKKYDEAEHMMKSKNPVKKLKGAKLYVKTTKKNLSYIQPVDVDKHGRLRYDGAVAIDAVNNSPDNKGKKDAFKAGKVYDGVLEELVVKKGKKYAKYNIAPARERKPGKYLDMYNKKKKGEIVPELSDEPVYVPLEGEYLDTVLRQKYDGGRKSNKK